MAEHIIKVSDDFWNIRGDFKIGGVINIGTHASLVRLKSGRFVLLDAYTLNDDIKAEVDTYTNGGEAIDAIINLHPFHTVHVEPKNRQYPNAKLYGTERHLKKFPDLPWEPERTESEEFAQLFADDFEFSVPAGVDFIPSNENLHFSSVLAYHKASKTIHVDDTLMFLKLPGLFGKMRKPKISFHPTLAKTLEKRAGAVDDFRAWAKELVEQWGDAEVLCAAHTATLEQGDIGQGILAALAKVEKVLAKHQGEFG